MIQHDDCGPLFAALSKAQAEFGTVIRDRRVTVTMKSGGAYTFNYAPLDTILAAVRKPLADNGLAFVQMLDDGGLTSMLTHESGGYLSARMALPDVSDVQALGSAVTYLRRYAIQAMLGIAAEEDDDGNRAAGNVAVPADVERNPDGSLIGIVQVGDKITSDYLLRPTEDGSHGLGFRLRGERGGGGILVEATGDLAVQLDTHREAVIGHNATVWGTLQERSFKQGRKTVTYQALAATQVSVTGLGVLPMEGEPKDPDTVPMFTDDEEAAFAEALASGFPYA